MSADVEVHAVVPGPASAAGVAYLRQLAGTHEAVRRAAGTSARQVELLRGALAIPPPSGLAEAEIARLELLAELGEHLLLGAGSPAEAIHLLAPELSARSLPLDRVSARALVVLGDAAKRTGDDALAATSYARAIRVMSMLRQELEP
jgi:hypothetical protein